MLTIPVHRKKNARTICESRLQIGSSIPRCNTIKSVLYAITRRLTEAGSFIIPVNLSSISSQAIDMSLYLGNGEPFAAWSVRAKMCHPDDTLSNKYLCAHA